MDCWPVVEPSVAVCLRVPQQRVPPTLVVVAGIGFVGRGWWVPTPVPEQMLVAPCLDLLQVPSGRKRLGPPSSKRPRHRSSEDAPEASFAAFSGISMSGDSWNLPPSGQRAWFFSRVPCLTMNGPMTHSAESLWSESSEQQEYLLQPNKSSRALKLHISPVVRILAKDPERYWHQKSVVPVGEITSDFRGKLGGGEVAEASNSATIRRFPGSLTASEETLDG